MTDTPNENFSFICAQDLGLPSIGLPAEPGKIPVALQFIIPTLNVGESGKSILLDVANTCLRDVVNTNIKKLNNTRTNKPAALVTFTFYVDDLNEIEKNQKNIFNKTRGLIEKYLGILSFFSGIKLSAAHPQFTNMQDPAHQVKTLLTIGRGEGKFNLDFLKAKDFCMRGNVPSDKVFSALFWLRRGIAERDPIETYSSLMICLQILARDCGILTNNGNSISSLFKELLVEKLSASDDLADGIWRMRNKVVAHGNKTPLDADTFIELTQLKFPAAELAFKGVGLALGLDSVNTPTLHQGFNVTDALMYLD